MVTVPQLWLSILVATALCTAADWFLDRVGRGGDAGGTEGTGQVGRAVVYYLVVAGAIAWLASQTIAPGMAYLFVFKVTGTVAFLTHVAALFHPAARPAGLPRRALLGRGMVSALLTAGAFAGFWPA